MRRLRSLLRSRLSRGAGRIFCLPYLSLTASPTYRANYGFGAAAGLAATLHIKPEPDPAQAAGGGHATRAEKPSRKPRLAPFLVDCLPVFAGRRVGTGIGCRSRSSLSQ